MLGCRLLPWEYGVRNLLRRPSRTVLTLLALTIVVLLVFVVVAFIQGLEASLQARVDVRLEDVGHVVPGQTVTMESAATAGRLVGHVVTATSQANIQKNTLEVKVAIEAPPAALWPEMIVNATFLAPELPTKSGSGSEAPERIFVPRPLVEGTGAEATAWVAAHDGTARKRTLNLGGNGPGDLVEVLSGLNPTDRLIADGRDRLADGQRIEIVGDDATFSSAQR